MGSCISQLPQTSRRFISRLLSDLPSMWSSTRGSPDRGLNPALRLTKPLHRHYASGAAALPLSYTGMFPRVGFHTDYLPSTIRGSMDDELPGGGAATGIQTPDLLITKQVLYR